MDANIINKNLEINCPICKEKLKAKKTKSLNTKDNISLDLKNKSNNQEHKINLIQDIQTCHQCYYSTIKKDFEKGIHAEKSLKSQTKERENIVKELLKSPEIKNKNTPEYALLNYILAIECYKIFDKKYNPSFKKAVCAIRIIWLSKELYINTNNNLFNNINIIFNKKATQYYSQAFTASQTKEEPFKKENCIGPDVNQNWGYQGLLYLTGYFNYLIAINKTNPIQSKNTLLKVRQIMKTIPSLKLTEEPNSQILIKYAKKIDILANNHINKLKNQES